MIMSSSVIPSRFKVKHFRHGIDNGKLMLFNMDICGCCNNLAVKEIFPAYEFMNTDSLEVAGIPLSVIPERHIVLDPVSGEFVCNVCIA